MSATETNDRFARQGDLVPQDALAGVAVVVVGVGAVGRQVALQLAPIGLRRMHLVDFDTIEMTNVTTQGYLPEDIGEFKVDIMQNDCECCVPEEEGFDCVVHNERITAALLDKIVAGNRPRKTVVFSCVDSIETRAKLVSWVHELGLPLMVDGRMRGEVLRVLTATVDSYDAYRATLFAGSEALDGRCTARVTLYGASILAGLMVHQFTRWLRSGPLDNDLMVTLSDSQMFVPGPEASFDALVESPDAIHEGTVAP
jgi:sulfur carrier protein ThiS adenylyltransferase